MFDSNVNIDMNSCRICLSSKKSLCPLFKYKLSGNYAEMLTAIADIKVAANDGLPEKICTKCCGTLEKAYLLKTLAERSDKKLRNALKIVSKHAPTKKIVFDSFNDVKSEIAPLAIKDEPKWELEVEIFDGAKPVESIEGKDIVIANTVIRKLDSNYENVKKETNDKVDLTWKSSRSKKQADYKSENVDDEAFQDDFDDDDYVPPAELFDKKQKFRKPKLCDIKVYREKKALAQKMKKNKCFAGGLKSSSDSTGKPTSITCYPIMKNGSRGPPILLKRPKDATILKVHASHKQKNPSDKPIRMVRSAKPIMKEKEKLVCPVCGILTYALGNHLSTHQEKKRYNCPQCSKTFSQKGNLHVHMKQHTGVKDHICEVCGAGFYSQKSLIRHNLIHKGERPFSCNLCTKKFIARCDLNRHLRIHSGYKPFKCGNCTMSFNAKHQLQNHERMHTGERPYTCQICNVAFSYKVNLNNHVYKVHGVNIKYKTIHNVTEEVLRRELEIVNEAVISHIIPQLGDVPTPAAHETVHHSEYTV